MSNLVAPHGGGPLHPLLLPEYERVEEKKRAAKLKQVPMSSRELSDLLMLGMGAYTPLQGFMSEADWRGACADMTLASGLFWPIPITLSCSADLADEISEGDDVALCNGSGDIFGVLNVEEKYSIDKAFIMSSTPTKTPIRAYKKSWPRARSIWPGQ